MRLLVASRTDVGRVRAGNEDSFVVTDDARLVAVADGMGGHQAGEVASATAIAALLDGLARDLPIGEAVWAANDAVVEQAAGDPALRGMGTTLTAGVLDDSALVIGHVGDSRAYLLRDGELRQVTTDHSVVAELVAAGEITEDEALVDPRRSMITRTIGIEATVEVDVLELPLAPGDRLLLCSDGLTTMVRDGAIAEILASEPDRERAADELVAAANLAGGTDNITVVVADVVDDAAGGAVVDALDIEDDEVAGDDADTLEVPVVDVGPDDPTAPDASDAADVDDDELEELRAAVEETPPRRRWWQRRARS